MIRATRTEGQPACRTDRRDASIGGSPSGSATVVSSVREARGKKDESRDHGGGIQAWHRGGAGRGSHRSTEIVVERRR